MTSLLDITSYKQRVASLVPRSGSARKEDGEIRSRRGSRECGRLREYLLGLVMMVMMMVVVMVVVRAGFV